jgi:hypothetical protein
LSLVSVILPRSSVAGDLPDPFAYTWKIVYRGKDIGRARSLFSYREGAGGVLLVEEGVRTFSVGLGGVTVDCSEEIEVVRDADGLMKTYRCRRTIDDSVEERYAQRTDDSALVLKITGPDGTTEEMFGSEAFDYTDADLFAARLDDPAAPRTFRILFIGRNQVVPVTYRATGRETAAAGGADIAVRRVTAQGPKSEATMLVDDLGIAVRLTMESLFGDFSFILTGRE